MWWWRKVRRAGIPRDMRDQFEQWGVEVLSQAISISQPYMGEDLKAYVPHDTGHREQVLAWLTEMSDREVRREDRLETLEWAILIFVVIETLLSTAEFIWR